jgi:hypothetical protein
MTFLIKNNKQGPILDIIIIILFSMSIGYYSSERQKCCAADRRDTRDGMRIQVIFKDEEIPRMFLVTKRIPELKSKECFEVPNQRERLNDIRGLRGRFSR